MTRSLAFLLVRVAVPVVRRRRRGWWLLAAAATAGPGGCAAGDEPEAGAPAAARIVRVIDGDTLVARAGGRRVTVRLLGIDTPETHPGPAVCGGAAATRRLARIAPPGGRVRLVTDPASGDIRDRYGRLLAYVEGPQGDLGERQLRAGLAHVYRYRGRRFSRLDRYRRAEAVARVRRHGSWSTCATGFHTGRSVADGDQQRTTEPHPRASRARAREAFTAPGTAPRRRVMSRADAAARGDRPRVRQRQPA
jgi:endonuclease YncB( thermonuclease family)